MSLLYHVRAFITAKPTCKNMPALDTCTSIHVSSMHLIKILTWTFPKTSSESDQGFTSGLKLTFDTIPSQLACS